jgi:hypothetical protein
MIFWVKTHIWLSFNTTLLDLEGFKLKNPSILLGWAGEAGRIPLTYQGILAGQTRCAVLPVTHPFYL